MPEAAEGYSIATALTIALIAYFGIIFQLGPGLWSHEALVAGALTGWVVGDVQLGLEVGATLTLMSLGLWTYGGATIPDFHLGAIIGTAIGALGGGLTAGLAVAIPTAVLMTQMDILGRALNTFFIHGADKYVEDANLGGVTLMHLLGTQPWGLTRAIPTFLAVWLGAGPIQRVIDAMPQWFTEAMQTTGAILPALGFALLLAQLPVRKYWPFLLLGYVIFAYFQIPILGLALLALAVAFIYERLRGGEVSG